MENKEMKVYHVGLFHEGKGFIRNFEVEAESEIAAIHEAESMVYYASLDPDSPVDMLGAAWSITDDLVRDINFEFEDGKIIYCTLKINHLHLIKKEDQINKLAI